MDALGVSALSARPSTSTSFWQRCEADGKHSTSLIRVKCTSPAPACKACRLANALKPMHSLQQTHCVLVDLRGFRNHRTPHASRTIPFSSRSDSEVSCLLPNALAPRLERHRRVVTTRSSSGSADRVHVFGEKGYVAGIPLADTATGAGARLRYCLVHRPHEFVSAALRELAEAAAAIAAAAQACALQSTQAQPRVSSTQRSELEDLMYCWTVAEAYVQHPQVQADMRSALQREPPGALAAGPDRLKLQSRVQLLEGAHCGQYMIGSVRFAPVLPGAASAEAPTVSSQAPIMWGGRHTASPPPPVHLIGPEAGNMLVAFEGDTPTRMNRKGAARTYHMYLYWGYFNRRMAERKSSVGASDGSPLLGGPALAGATPAGAAPAEPASSYAGEINNIWRYFERVPEGLTSMRTQEAANVADTHLRALFGDGDECITTLQAWQQMTNEARWVGRALYDAEEMVLLAMSQAENASKPL